jgi:flagellin
MAMTINTNVPSLNAQRNLSRSQDMLQSSLQRLSSGLRINSAKDDAAGLAISTRMSAQTRGLNQAARNANDGISMAQTAEGALQENTKILQRIRELAIQSANDSNSAMDREALNNEAQSLLAEAQRIAVSTEFNGKKLIDGSLTGSQFHVGAYANQTISVNVGNSQISNLGSYQVTSGLTNVTAAKLEAGDLLINGHDVGVSVDGSAESKTTAINAVSDLTGVSATASTELASANALARNQTLQAGDLVINGVNIGAIAGSNNVVIQGENIANAINNVANQTGVQAVHSQSTGALTLTSSTGKNIDITSLNGNAGYSRLENATGLEVSASTEQAQSTYTLANGSAAVNTLLFENDAAAVDDTVVVGGVTFTFAVAADLDNNVVAHGASAADSAAGLRAGIAARIADGTLKNITETGTGANVVITSTAATATTDHTDITATLATGANATLTATTSEGGLAAGNTLQVGGVTYEFVLNADEVTSGNAAVVLGADNNAIAANLEAAIDAQYTAGNTNIQASVSGAVVTLTSDLKGTHGNSTVDGTETVTGATADSLVENLAGGTGPAADGTGTALTGYGEITLNSGSSFLITGNAPGKAGLENAAVSLSSVNQVDLRNVEGANEAISLLDGAMTQITNMRGDLGAIQNRFASTIANLESTSENISAANARIMDADFASETANMTKAQILQQAGTAMLAQANNLPQNVLSLLQ